MHIFTQKNQVFFFFPFPFPGKNELFPIRTVIFVTLIHIGGIAIVVGLLVSFHTQYNAGWVKWALIILGVSWAVESTLLASDIDIQQPPKPPKLPKPPKGLR